MNLEHLIVEEVVRRTAIDSKPAALVGVMLDTSFAIFAPSMTIFSEERVPPALSAARTVFPWSRRKVSCGKDQLRSFVTFTISNLPTPPRRRRVLDHIMGHRKR